MKKNSNYKKKVTPLSQAVLVLFLASRLSAKVNFFSFLLLICLFFSCKIKIFFQKKHFVYLSPKIYNLKKTFSCHDNILFSNSFIYPQLSDRQDFFQISIELFVLLLFMYLFPKSSKVVYTLLVSFTCTNLSFFVVMVTA